MSVLDDLTSDNARVRLRALQNLDLNQDCPYSVLSQVFELLEDENFIEETDSSTEARNSDKNFREAMTKEPRAVFISEAARLVLLSLRKLPDYFLDLLLEDMDDMNSRSASWLMGVFYDFPWEDTESAFQQLVPLIFSSKSPNVINLFENPAFKDVKPLLNRIFYKDSSGYFVFQALVQSRTKEVREYFNNSKNQNACVDLLVDVSDNYKSEVLWIYLDSLFTLELDNNIFTGILKQAVKYEVNYCPLYLALFDSRYTKSAYKELNFIVSSSTEMEKYLIPIILYLLEQDQVQQKYPVELLFSCFNSEFWLTHLEKLSGTHLQEQLLKNLLVREKDRKYRFPILFQMLLRNLLKNKPELITELWITLEAEMAGPTPPKEENHPLVIMASENLCPNGYNSFIYKQLKRGTITPSFALSFWTPTDTAPPTIAFLLSVIEREIIKTKEKWEHEKRAHKNNPKKYYYSSQRAPNSVLESLDYKWKDMLIYLDQNNHQRVLHMAQNLMTIPWANELKSIAEASED